MAYKFQRDGETIIRFEKGKWDSFWGYQCPECKWLYGDPSAAHDHENEIPACHARRDEG